MTTELKDRLKQELAQCLGQAQEIRKIVVFGSFLTSEVPKDIDIAIFQDTEEDYLPLALKYRRLAKSVAEQISIDIIPLRPAATGSFMDEISKGEVIYER